MRRLVIALTATAVALLVTASLAAASIIPRAGHYAGHDVKGHHITFYFRDHMSHFTVDEFLIGGASVSGHQWHHTCHNGYCTRGQWHTQTQVQGFWNHSASGSDVHFIAHWVKA
jgi:hypothetical protein